ncbi:hypothetical protein QBC46DRAFT_376989 [Diplogelasinospora grovesii]|uniref:Septum formation initiator domain-containing protein n=1 Tax=Diplogelasinospora grovesii TaxID=303347 RepID=A0AAN6NFA3_9PEZI|nr:hypothetical protein QBC46DRAFT_376989 [Diplogelasinospora grovesii]
MSHNGADAPKGPLPSRPRHQITRSITELSSPIRLHRHHSHRIVGKEKERDALSPVPQPAMPLGQPRLSLDASRSEGMTPNLTPNASRRTSILLTATDDSNNPAVVASTSDRSSPPNKTSKEQEFTTELQKAAARETGLKKTLNELETFSTATARRLDETYYSVLEKLGMLHSTLVALKEIAGLSVEMNDNFSREVQEMEVEVTSQLDAFGQFEDQQHRIETLQNRIQAAKDKIKALSERVDIVRDRIESWERADREWQERTRKRLKAIWVVTSLVVFIILLLFVISAQYAPDGFGSGNHSEVAGSSSSSSSSSSNATIRDKLWLNRTEPAKASSVLADEMLRVFDEL